MNFFSIIIYGYLLIAALLICIFLRDWRKKIGWFGRHKIITWCAIVILFISISCAVDARFVEPFHLTTNYEKLIMFNIKEPISIAFVSDTHVGEHKKAEWIEKIAQKLKQINPDLILFGGDYISNQGTFIDESRYLEPLRELVGKYPMYYIMGNHEYGIGSLVRDNSSYWTGDRSEEVQKRMQSIGIPLLKETLACPKIKNEKICIYGIDDIWHATPTFKNLPTTTIPSPLIFLTHNPDGILYWPKDKQKPSLVLAGHTHGGQIWLPGFGPLVNPGVKLDEKYFRGPNYYNYIPIYTSAGTGESGGPIRFFSWPEIAVIQLWP